MDPIKISNSRLRRICLGLAALGAALALAACGGGGGGIEGGGDSGSVSTVKLSPPASGDLFVSNWPDYIDSKTVGDYEQASGVKVRYTEDVNDNQEFFAKMQQLLAKGQSGGRSVMVVTDWMAKKMYDLGYLQDLDPSGIPNVEANLRPDLKSPDFDPDRKFSVPWQSGMTGLIVDKTKAPDVRSICDLFDPQYKGQVEMLTELRDTVPLVMKCMGVDPTDATQDDWLAAIDKIKGAVDQGQIRRFAGNDYTRDMANGDATAIIGWSGDAEQLKADNPNIEFRMPTEGCILWSDNMVIPVGAPNPTAAESWMNYVYDPANQAQIAEYVNYITPVAGVDKVLGAKDPELLKDQLIFPTEDYTKNCSVQPNLTGEEEQTVTQAFEGVLNG
jgi:spermidine/putrescine transport system substrate-binding protein